MTITDPAKLYGSVARIAISIARSLRMQCRIVGSTGSRRYSRFASQHGGEHVLDLTRATCQKFSPDGDAQGNRASEFDDHQELLRKRMPLFPSLTARIYWPRSARESSLTEGLSRKAAKIASLRKNPSAAMPFSVFSPGISGSAQPDGRLERQAPVESNAPSPTRPRVGRSETAIVAMCFVCSALLLVIGLSDRARH